MTCRYGFIGGVIQSSDLLSGHVQYSSQRMYKKIYLSKPYHRCKMSKNLKTVPSFFVDVSLERRNKNTISVFNLTLCQIEGFVTFVWGDRLSCYLLTPTHAKVGGIFPLLYFYFPQFWNSPYESGLIHCRQKVVLAHCTGYFRHRC